MSKMQRLGRFIYPHQCLICDEMVEEIDSFCPSCWSTVDFILDSSCASCGRPMIGEVEEGDVCDSCLQNPPPWSRGRSVFVYNDGGRRFVLQLKNGDKTHLTRAAGRWMAHVAKPLLRDDSLIVPVPQHWMRSLQRKYSQSVMLSRRVAQNLGVEHRPNLLVRKVPTRKLAGLGGLERKREISGSIEMRAGHGSYVDGRHVILVDDILTSGATLAECAQACFAAGARNVSIVTLAVVAKGG